MALGLSVSWLGDLCLALGLSVICGNYVGHWVCLFVCWLGDLCLALCLSVICGNYMLGTGFVCWLGDLCLVMVGLFATSTAD